jgi:hypothetical protein
MPPLYCCLCATHKVVCACEPRHNLLQAVSAGSCGTTCCRAGARTRRGSDWSDWFGVNSRSNKNHPGTTLAANVSTGLETLRSDSTAALDAAISMPFSTEPQSTPYDARHFALPGALDVIIENSTSHESESTDPSAKSSIVSNTLMENSIRSALSLPLQASCRRENMRQTEVRRNTAEHLLRTASQRSPTKVQEPDLGKGTLLAGGLPCTAHMATACGIALPVSTRCVQGDSAPSMPQSSTSLQDSTGMSGAQGASLKMATNIASSVVPKPAPALPGSLRTGSESAVLLAIVGESIAEGDEESMRESCSSSSNIVERGCRNSDVRALKSLAEAEEEEDRLKVEEKSGTGGAHVQEEIQTSLKQWNLGEQTSWEVMEDIKEEDEEDEDASEAQVEAVKLGWKLGAEVRSQQELQEQQQQQEEEEEEEVRLAVAEELAAQLHVAHCAGEGTLRATPAVACASSTRRAVAACLHAEEGSVVDAAEKALIDGGAVGGGSSDGGMAAALPDGCLAHLGSADSGESVEEDKWLTTPGHMEDRVSDPSESDKPTVTAIEMLELGDFEMAAAAPLQAERQDSHNNFIVGKDAIQDVLGVQRTGLN